ncbi:MAG: DUF4188 domain-containing protein [Anaerolineae bacterium]|jgi:hypothetical protein|nr:DUF4188 domain-containing protein [Anaerolineae bacterium]
MTIMPGRYTAITDEPFVVFLIGMRLNRLLAVRRWLPVFNAMGGMLSTLHQHPEKGYLGGEFYLYWRGVALVQYWRSFEALEQFARSPSDPHLAAWRSYNQAIGSDGTVGVWHETYRIDPGQYECVYANMPRFGLGAVLEHAPARGRRETARQRLGGESAPAVPAPD